MAAEVHRITRDGLRVDGSDARAYCTCGNGVEGDGASVREWEVAHLQTVGPFSTLVAEVTSKRYQEERRRSALRILAGFAAAEWPLVRTDGEIDARVVEAYRWADAFLSEGRGRPAPPMEPGPALDERRRRDHEDLTGVPNEEAQ